LGSLMLQRWTPSCRYGNNFADTLLWLSCMQHTGDTWYKVAQLMPEFSSMSTHPS
jgi:hypothetical protein